MTWGYVIVHETFFALMPPNSQLLSLLGGLLYAGEFWLTLIE